MIGASLAFTGMVASIKLASGRGVPLAHIIFYRGAFSVLVMSAYLKYRNLPLGSPHWRMHLRRAIAGYGSWLWTAIPMHQAWRPRTCPRRQKRAAMGRVRER